MSKLDPTEVKVCLATLNNFILEQKLDVTGKEAVHVTAMLNECHRLCNIIDEEANESEEGAGDVSEK